ncbi:MAG: hypothetical protein JWO30_3449 [Fibrobacteres bacterium]|nr:hypothetical protein [Fibrobacterota bacterium]
MKLVRFAIINLFDTNEAKPIEIEINGSRVILNPATDEGQKGVSYLAVAKYHLSKPLTLDEIGRILIPEEEKGKCEYAIESIADILSVFGSSRRSLLSPTPCAAIEFESETEKEFLKSTKGIKVNQKQYSTSKFIFPFESQYINAITDRLGGVALLAEVNTEGEAGKYRDLVRFFEFAFNRPFTQLDKIIHSFLAPMPYGYERKEIKEWISFRHAASHADLQKTQGFAVTSDVRDFLMRMEQAALDTLFNKKEWHNASTLRRDIWRPQVWSKSAKGDLSIIQGSKDVSIFFRTYDDLGSYPRNLKASVSPISENWYCHFYMDPNAPKNPGSIQAISLGA